MNGGKGHGDRSLLRCLCARGKETVMSPWIHPRDSGSLWLMGKQDCPCVRSQEERAGPGSECFLTCTRLNDYGRRGFALRADQEQVQPRPAVVGQSAAAEGGTDIHPGDPETQRPQEQEKR